MINHQVALLAADGAAPVLLGKQFGVPLHGELVSGQPLSEREVPVLGRVLVLVIPRQRPRVRAGLAVVPLAVLGSFAVVELAKRLVLTALIAVLGGLGEIRTLSLLLAGELLFRWSYKPICHVASLAILSCHPRSGPLRT